MIEPTQQEIETARALLSSFGLHPRTCGPAKAAAICDRLAHALASAREAALREAAEVVDQCNREGPYNAIGAASRIRALIGDANG